MTPGTPTMLPARIGRQAIVDADRRTVAGELLFRGLNADRSALDASRTDEATVTSGDAPGTDGDRATSHVIVTTFCSFGLALLGAGKPLFLNMTRAFLVGDHPLPFGPDGIVLEILEDIVVDDILVAGVTRLRDQGFTFALDDYVGEPSRSRLLPLVDVIKVDIQAPGVDVATLAGQLRTEAPHATLLAERVETSADFDECRLLGFELYQGYHFARPDVLEARHLSPSQITCLRLVTALARPDTAIEELERVVHADPGLAMHVLTLANSSAVGARRAISSLRHALVLLGPHTLRSWIVLALLAGSTSTDTRSDLITILTRAGACAALAQHLDLDVEQARTIGLLSGVADVLGTAAGPLATSAGLSAPVVGALAHGIGGLGNVLRAIRGHELDRQGVATDVGLDDLELSNLCLRAWADAVRVASSMD